MLQSEISERQVLDAFEFQSHSSCGRFNSKLLQIQSLLCSRIPSVFLLIDFRPSARFVPLLDLSLSKASNPQPKAGTGEIVQLLTVKPGICWASFNVA